MLGLDPEGGVEDVLKALAVSTLRGSRVMSTATSGSLEYARAAHRDLGTIGVREEGGLGALPVLAFARVRVHDHFCS